MSEVAAKVSLWPYVEAVAASAMTAHTALTELIDNAFDFDATNVTVDARNGKHLSVTDNGIGISKIEKLVEFGGHEGNGRGSGLYGVGMKEASLRLGGSHSTVHVSTLHGDTFTRAAIEWQRLRERPECMSVTTGSSAQAVRGTKILITPLKMRMPEGKDRDRLLSQLGYTYSRALRDGRAILVTLGGKSYSIKPFAPPMLEDVIDTDVDVGGRKVKLYAGIVPTGHINEWPGVTYSRGYRVVKAASRSGCGDFSHNRIYAVVDVSDAWRRSKNKDDLIDAEDLYVAVYEALRPLLQKAETQTRDISLTTNLAGVEQAINSAFGLSDPDSKAKRGDGDTHGSIDPNGKGGKHKRAKKTQPGTRFMGKGGPSRIKVSFNPGWYAGAPIGRLDASTSCWWVTLYSDHPLIARALNPWNKDAIIFAVMTVVALFRRQLPLLNDSDPVEDLARLATLTAGAFDVGDDAPQLSSKLDARQS